MTRTALQAAMLLFLASLPRAAGAADASDFSGMEGWTITAVTQVADEFEGCDFDKQIKFTNGLVLSCATYSYSYSFMPRAVIFGSSRNVQGSEFYSVKALIGDQMYDMQPVLKQ